MHDGFDASIAEGAPPDVFADDFEDAADGFFELFREYADVPGLVADRLHARPGGVAHLAEGGLESDLGALDESADDLADDGEEGIGLVFEVNVGVEGFVDARFDAVLKLDCGGVAIVGCVEDGGYFLDGEGGCFLSGCEVGRKYCFGVVVEVMGEGFGKIEEFRAGG